MINVLENQKGAIAKLFRKYNVERLFAFGSAIRDDYRPGESDVVSTCRICADWRTR